MGEKRDCDMDCRPSFDGGHDLSIAMSERITYSAFKASGPAAIRSKALAAAFFKMSCAIAYVKCMSPTQGALSTKLLLVLLPWEGRRCATSRLNFCHHVSKILRHLSQSDRRSVNTTCCCPFYTQSLSYNVYRTRSSTVS